MRTPEGGRSVSMIGGPLAGPNGHVVVYAQLTPFAFPPEKNYLNSAYLQRTQEGFRWLCWAQHPITVKGTTIRVAMAPLCLGPNGQSAFAYTLEPTSPDQQPQTGLLEFNPDGSHSIIIPHDEHDHPKGQTAMATWVANYTGGTLFFSSGPGGTHKKSLTPRDVLCWNNSAVTVARRAGQPLPGLPDYRPIDTGNPLGERIEQVLPHVHTLRAEGPHRQQTWAAWTPTHASLICPPGTPMPVPAGTQPLINISAVFPHTADSFTIVGDAGNHTDRSQHAWLLQNGTITRLFSTADLPPPEHNAPKVQWLSPCVRLPDRSMLAIAAMPLVGANANGGLVHIGPEGGKWLVKAGQKQQDGSVLTIYDVMVGHRQTDAPAFLIQSKKELEASAYMMAWTGGLRTLLSHEHPAPGAPELGPIELNSKLAHSHPSGLFAISVYGEKGQALMLYDLAHPDAVIESLRASPTPDTAKPAPSAR